MPIAVTGCATSLPSEFPMDNNWREYGHKDLANFANKACSHIIFTLANTIRMGETDRWRRHRKSDFDSFFEPIDGLIGNFNRYLDASGLPKVAKVSQS